MKSYRYVGDAPVLVPDLGREVQPGEIVRTEIDIQNAQFEPVAEPRSRANREE